jgi:hypothetical protein
VYLTASSSGHRSRHRPSCPSPAVWRDTVDPRVAAYVAARITDAIVAQRPNLVSVRSVIQPAVTGVVASAPFRAVVRTSARAAHRSLFESAARNVVMSLPDVSVLVRGALANVNPDLAAKLPPSIETRLASPQAERAFTRFLNAWALVGRVLWAAWALLLLGLTAVVASIWATPDRQTALVRAGGGLFAVALALIAVLPAGRILAAAITPDPEMRGVAHGLWLAYFGVLKLVAVIVGCVGVVLAAAGSTMLEAMDPVTRAKAFLGWLTAPLRPRARIGRALLYLAAGTYAAVSPTRAGAALVAVVGLSLIYLGLREVFRLVITNAQAVSAAPTARPEARAWRAVALVAAMLVVALGGTALLVFRHQRRPQKRQASSPYAMVPQSSATGASTRSSWRAHTTRCRMPRFLVGCSRTIATRFRASSRTACARCSSTCTTESPQAITCSPISTGRAPRRTRSRGCSVRKRQLRLSASESGSSYGVRSVGHLLLPRFCELGAYPVGPTLDGVREFMLTNPGEVVVIVVEDYITPEDVARLFQEAGLLDLIYTGSLTKPVPTLRQMIDGGQRLVVFGESGRPGVPWLRPAWDFMQETPFSFHKPADFSCRPNRGGATAPFFQINHWIETTPAPRPSNAEIVNAYDFLLRRVRACREQRNHLPNILAVDFYDVGDLFRVVRAMNGVEEPATVARAP